MSFGTCCCNLTPHPSAHRRRSILRLILLFVGAFVISGSWTAYGQRGEDYITLARDGAWCWFSDPRAIYHKGYAERIYAGWASAKGDVVVGSYDCTTGSVRSSVVMPALQRDDHINPSLLMLPDGRIMVFFTKHFGGGFYWTTSLQPEDITAFETVHHADLGTMQCYSNPVMLSEEANRIYVFFRGGYDWKPSYIYSDDCGRSWSRPRVIVAKPGAPQASRPYTKVATDGRSTVHFAFTDGHPRDEPTNAIYYMRYSRGTFYDAAGRTLGDTASLPIDQNLVPKAYDGKASGVRSWIWDIAADESGRPAIVYSLLPEDAKHYYGYASWNGSQWTNWTLCRAGSWFPRYDKTKEECEPEPHYSGGICLDPRQPGTVYLSRPHNDIFEIERWVTPDRGSTWSQLMVTDRSDHDNVRPYVIRGCPSDKSLRLLWMNNRKYRHYTDFDAAIMAGMPASGVPDSLNAADIMNVLTRVADWQIENFPRVKHHELDWTCGAFYAGMMAFGRIAGDTTYLDWLAGIGKKYQWQPSYRLYHADDVCVSQMFLDMYRLKHDELMVLPTKARIDWVMQNPSKATLALDYAVPSTTDRWSWCDALFMAPPVYAKLAAITGDTRYLFFMHKEFTATYDFLYDKDRHLFFRDHRYFAQREANGEKVFWGRGNGWVLAGLANLLKELPSNFEHRRFYEKLFREMAAAVARVQDKGGFWHASLLDPASYPNPETSSSGFFCYALAYGIKSGLLNRDEYLPVVARGWSALVNAVSPDGRLGWIQPIGADPKTVDRHMTDVYGVGAFLLAGSEICTLF